MKPLRNMVIYTHRGGAYTLDPLSLMVLGDTSQALIARSFRLKNNMITVRNDCRNDRSGSRHHEVKIRTLRFLVIYGMRSARCQVRNANCEMRDARCEMRKDMANRLGFLISHQRSDLAP